MTSPQSETVTAEDVRKFRAASECKHGECKWCVADRAQKFLPLLLKHGGISSSAKAVIEAMIGGAS